MNQELIEQIRKAVEKVLREQTSATTGVENEKRLLAIFGATQLELDEPLQQLRICEQNGWKVTIILSELATKVLNLEPIYDAFGRDNILAEHVLNDIPALVAAYQHIVIPAFSHPMVAKLALRLVDTPCSYLIFEALSKGKRVIAASDTLDQSETSTKIGAIELQYVNVLSEIGVQLVPILKIAGSVTAETGSLSVTTSEALISASTIANLAANVHELVYANSAIITPLAREYAKKRGIKLMSKD